MSLAQKIWYSIEKDLSKGWYQSELENRVKNRPDFKGEETTKEEIDFMMNGEKNSLHKELFDEKYHNEAVEMFMEMIEAFNSSSHTETNKALLEAINKTHRYTQGEFFNNLLKVIFTFSQQDERFFDGRNIGAKDIATRMCEQDKHWLQLINK